MRDESDLVTIVAPDYRPATSFHLKTMCCVFTGGNWTRQQADLRFMYIYRLTEYNWVYHALLSITNTTDLLHELLRIVFTYKVFNIMYGLAQQVLRFKDVMFWHHGFIAIVGTMTIRKIKTKMHRNCQGIKDKHHR